jgi:NAD(P) transhydrogenase
VKEDITVQDLGSETRQVVARDGATVDYLVDAVFNFPTLTEAYKVAALNATNKLRTLSRLTSDAGRPA